MADKLLKSIKFPTLPDRYVIGDTSLSEEGAAAEAKAVGEAIATKADTKGTYEDLIVGGAEQLMADGCERDSEPYLFRPTGGSADVGNREYLDKIIGGTVAWNQLCNGSSVTVQSGRKYLLKKGTAWSIGASTGTAITGLTSGSDMLIDLTALFNPTIADYIYSLEQSQAGAGVAWFRQYFPEDYYPYDPGTLRSVEGVSAHEMVGKNLADMVSDGKTPSISTGALVSYAQSTHSKMIKVSPSTSYTASFGNTLLNGIFQYDEDGNFIKADQTTETTKTITTTGTSAFIMLRCDRNSTSEPIPNCQLELGTTATAYEPHTKHTYPLDSSLTLRGVPKLVDGKLAFDGDVYPPSGEVQRRYGIVDLGTLNWTAFPSQDNLFYVNLPTKKSGSQNCISKYPITAVATWEVMPDKSLVANVNNSYIYIKDSSYTDAASFKAAMSGVYMVYELATPTTETAEGYEQYQICDPSGTEEFVTTGIVPVGHETRYPHDLKKKIETAPDSPSADGTYLMKRSGGKNTYMALPSTPSANGAYVLTVTVSGGSASYSWTAKE